MKRYYISPIIGDGTMNNPWRVKAADYAGVSTVSIMEDAPGGGPKFPWTICIVNAIDHTPLLADQDLFGLPEITLDSKLSVLKTADRSRLITFVQSKGIDVSGITVNSSFRELVRVVGRTLAAWFDENKFDI